uniref:Uncharacterized protein n=1 Tax=Mucochytrium quahogii TaxID=96639 RepID=A0A7S2REF9_9STRA|mmetsp:Transcript_31192/g.50049  ORF Transcript_31192/g.50049 Transcript_31192/m.50049 type:complete len:358 (+) Transcript_31192:1862-2935(+)
MTDLGLELFLAISAVKDEDKRNATAKKQRSKETGNGTSTGETNDETNKGGSANGTFLLHAEPDDSEDSDSDLDEESLGSVRSILVRKKSSSSKRRILGDGSARYQVLTGNVTPSKLSIAKVVNQSDLGKLTMGKNYGISTELSLVGRVKKSAIRKAKTKNSGLIFIIKQYPCESENCHSAVVTNSIGDLEEQISPRALILSKRMCMSLRKEPSAWPPSIDFAKPVLPYCKPPKVPGEPPKPPKGVYKHISTNSSSDFDIDQALEPPKPEKGRKSILRKITGASRRGIQSNKRGARGSVGEREFLVSADVPWVIPPPPRPRPPPKDDSGDAKSRKEFELMRMFCEDMRSTLERFEDMI